MVAMAITSSEDHAPALDGLLVIDASEGVGGPYAAMLLAEQGADVVKIERPDGDPARGTPAFHVLNRSKRSIVLDLDNGDGRRDLRELLRRAAVFVFDWQPGRAEELGVGREALRALNPGLVVAYLPAYGSHGPHAHRPPDEALAQALSGVSDAQFRWGETPVFVNIPIAGYAQAIVGAGAVTASLLARAQTGEGDFLELSQIAAIAAIQTAAYVRSPQVMRMAGATSPRGGIPTYRLVRASDDWLFAGALTPGFWASLAVAAGLEDCLVDPRFAGAPMAVPDLDDRKELAARLDAAFATRTREEWLRILEDAGVPRAPVMSREEFAADPQVEHMRALVDVDDPELGLTRQVNVPVALHDTPGRIQRAAPRLNEHASALAELIAAPSTPTAAIRPAASASQRRYPLEGVVIIDLTGFIAGATGSMALADMGADVIKIEPLDGDGWRTSGLAFLGSNRGKRSLSVDLKRSDGRALILDLVDRADVVMDNFRAGVMDRLGLGYETLSARNPRIIQCSVTGYGPTGPLSHLPAFDPLFQARAGIMRAQGESGGEPVYLQISACDYTTAMTAAFGVGVALVARERTGRGNRVETSLLQSALTVQAGEFVFYDGRPPDSPGGRDLKGRHALYRIYAASDAALTVACTTLEHGERFARALGMELPPGDPLSHAVEGEFAVAIAARIAGVDRDRWIERLDAAAVPCAPCIRVVDLFDDEHFEANGLWWDGDHERWGRVRQPGAAVAWHRMSMQIERPAPRLGEHSIEILRQFGVEETRIEALLAAGVVRQAPRGR
jgi:crotonobetainyl-CoA:carnitine CoA-transferase CaiB-like acyl-CoA transferase